MAPHWGDVPHAPAFNVAMFAWSPDAPHPDIHRAHHTGLSVASTVDANRPQTTRHFRQNVRVAGRRPADRRSDSSMWPFVLVS